ncbi:MAG: hypothetical protein HOV83_20720 [Catenulispora sp.]|nr:hypothetical protein [Catenulispora sp.]
MDGREMHDVVIGGAGQAGLSLSHWLTRAGVEHTVLERDRIGHSWDTGWESFCLATGGYQRPHRPPTAVTLPESVHALDAVGYHHSAALPPGGVLVVGSGRTGSQLAEELAESGRDVCLAYGRAPWMPRRIEDRDIFSWFEETTFFDVEPADRPDPKMQRPATAGTPRTPALHHPAHRHPAPGPGRDRTVHIGLRAGLHHRGRLPRRLRRPRLPHVPRRSRRLRTHRTAHH